MKVKTILLYLLYGIQWGITWLVFQTSLVILFKGNSAVLDPDVFLINVFCSILAGIGGAGTSVVYTFKNWSRKKQIFVHFTSGLSFFFLAAYLGKWFEFSFTPRFLLFFVGSVLIFFIVWLIFYLISTQIFTNDVNTLLKKLKKNQLSGH